MSVLVDSHVGVAPCELRATAGPPLQLSVQRVEITSEDGEVLQARAWVELDAEAWARVGAERLLRLQVLPSISGEGPVIALLGAVDEHLETIADVGAEALWLRLTSGDGGRLSDVDGWCALLADAGAGPMATGWAVRQSLGGVVPSALPEALQRPVAVLLLGGWEPAWSPGPPEIIVARVEPVDGGLLAVEISDDGAATLVRLSEPRVPGRSSPASALVQVTDDGDRTVYTAAVEAVGADLPTEVLEGMLAAVLDAATPPT